MKLPKSAKRVIALESFPGHARHSEIEFLEKPSSQDPHSFPLYPLAHNPKGAYSGRGGEPRQAGAKKQGINSTESNEDRQKPETGAILVPPKH